MTRLSVLLSLSLAACAAEPAGPDPLDPPDPAPSVRFPGSDVCLYVDGFLSDPDDHRLTGWLGSLGLPPGTCLDVGCVDRPTLRLCVGKGAPPAEVECTGEAP